MVPGRAGGTKGTRRLKPRPPAAGALHGGVAVDEEQRRRMVECCAFFNAVRFRAARPGDYRRQDLLDAEARIDAILERHKPR